VIEKAAKAEGSDPEEYFDFFKQNNPRVATDEEKAAFEEKVGKLFKQLPADRQRVIEEEIKRNRLARAKRRLINELVQRNEVNFTLKQPPQPIRDAKEAERRAQREEERKKRMEARENRTAERGGGQPAPTNLETRPDGPRGPGRPGRPDGPGGPRGPRGADQ
jgi:hypothetical protein